MSPWEVVTVALAALALVAAGLALYWAGRARHLAESLQPDQRRLLTVWRELEPAEAAGQLGNFLEQVARRLQTLDRRTQELAEHGRHVFSRSGFTRFDAREDIKGNLSFALALLDEEQNGFILTSLCTLQDSRVYLRPVRAGQVERELIPEEAEALRQARQARK